MKPSLTQAEASHLRKLLGWVRSEIGLVPSKGGTVPKYVHEAIAALDKLLVKQAPLVVDIDPKNAGPLPPVAMRPVWIGIDHGSGDDMTALPQLPPVTAPDVGFDADIEIGSARHGPPVGRWSKHAPTEPGTYLFKCDEDPGHVDRIEVFTDEHSGLLMIRTHDKAPDRLDWFHDDLTNPQWQKVEVQP